MQSSKLYWLIPIFIILLQAIYSFVSSQIRLEEVIESFRSAWWFQNHLVWNGSYSFLGWYTILSFVYSIFGMSFDTVKYIKLFIELVSFFCLAAVLKKYLGILKAILPLLIIGLSPTFMYFNSLQISSGTDVSFFLILLFVATKLDFKKKYVYIVEIIYGGMAMLAWLTYPGFIFYLPLLFFIYLYILFSQRRKYRLNFVTKNLIFTGLAFLFPLLILFFYIENRELLIYDPLLGLGIFRSYGTFELNLSVYKDSLNKIISDLFIQPSSLYFEAKKVEFSDFYPLLSLAFVFISSVYIFVKNESKRSFSTSRRLLIGIPGLFLLFYLILIPFIGPETIGGIRRATSLLVLFYGLMVIVWQYVLTGKKVAKNFKYLVIFLVMLLAFHHLAVYPANLENAKNPSVFRERWWFYQDNPNLTLKLMVEKLQKGDLVLACEDSKRTFQCPGLSLIYPALAGYCHFNKLNCKRIVAFSDKDQKYIPLSIDFWGKNSHTEP